MGKKNLNKKASPESQQAFLEILRDESKADQLIAHLLLRRMQVNGEVPENLEELTGEQKAEILLKINMIIATSKVLLPENQIRCDQNSV